MRRIELRLEQPTEEGETCIRLLANLPGEHLDACEAARLYRRRWTIEGMFQRLESVLSSEIRPLGHPRAALPAFAVAIVAYQVLVVLEAAVAANHDLESQGIELSTYYLADEVKRTYEGMMVALPEPEWHRFDHRSPAQLAKTLGRLAAHVKPRKYRTNPRKPKVKRKPGYAPRSAARRHVATARMLRNAGMSQGP
jgi:hypothetical protein